jgi:ribA/ribD-fused uncharacterized protein
MTKIDLFKGDYSWLSNFHMVPVEFEGLTYPSVEHAYQAAKSNCSEQRQRISEAATAGLAKRLGKGVTLRSDWEEVKIDIMTSLVRQKFSNPSLRALLLSTDDKELIEGNWWNDKFWGVCRGVGENHLGKILMRVRSELRSE